MSRVWQGLAMPWTDDIKTFAEPHNDEEVLKTSILSIVLTRLGERVMLPQFGCALAEQVFQPNNAGTAAAIEGIVRDAVRRWDDRIGVQDVTALVEDNSLTIKVSYRNVRDPMEDAAKLLEFRITPEQFGS